MNQIVRAWDRYKSRPKPNVPDAVYVEGQKIRLEEPDGMAERKKLDTGPHLEHAVKKGENNPDKNRVTKALSDQGYKNVIKLVKTASLDRVLGVRTATYNNLKRLQVKRDITKVHKRNPKDASSNGDIGTLITWMNSIEHGDRKAIKQLVAIDATACARGS